MKPLSNLVEIGGLQFFKNMFYFSSRHLKITKNGFFTFEFSQVFELKASVTLQSRKYFASVLVSNSVKMVRFFHVVFSRVADLHSFYSGAHFCPYNSFCMFTEMNLLFCTGYYLETLPVKNRTFFS